MHLSTSLFSSHKYRAQLPKKCALTYSRGKFHCTNNVIRLQIHLQFATKYIYCLFVCRSIISALSFHVFLSSVIFFVFLFAILFYFFIFIFYFCSLLPFVAWILSQHHRGRWWKSAELVLCVGVAYIVGCVCVCSCVYLRVWMWTARNIVAKMLCATL